MFRLTITLRKRVNFMRYVVNLQILFCLFYLSQQVRFPSDLRFIENFKNVFNVTLLEEIPQEEVRIYQATAKKWVQRRIEKKRSTGRIARSINDITYDNVHYLNGDSTPTGKRSTCWPSANLHAITAERNEGKKAAQK